MLEDCSKWKGSFLLGVLNFCGEFLLLLFISLPMVTKGTAYNPAYNMTSLAPCLIPEHVRLFICLFICALLNSILGILDMRTKPTWNVGLALCKWTVVDQFDSAEHLSMWILSSWLSLTNWFRIWRISRLPVTVVYMGQWVKSEINKDNRGSRSLAIAFLEVSQFCELSRLCVPPW